MSRKFFITILVFLTLAASLWIVFRHVRLRRFSRNPDSQTCQANNSQNPVFSPDRQTEAFATLLTNHWEVWASNLADKNCVLLVRIESGNEVGEMSWSPGGNLLAIETFNSNGHSPLTTTHVQIVRKDGTGEELVRLPSPNQHLSTHIAKWMNEHSLLVRATLLDRAQDVYYMFDYQTLTGTFLKQ